MHRGHDDDDFRFRIDEHGLAANAEQSEAPFVVDQPGLVAVAVEFRRGADREVRACTRWRLSPTRPG
jgi:hypothetical protein